jgi:hypothetical protein
VAQVALCTAWCSARAVSSTAAYHLPDLQTHSPRCPIPPSRAPELQCVKALA